MSGDSYRSTPAYAIGGIIKTNIEGGITLVPSGQVVTIKYPMTREEAMALATKHARLEGRTYVTDEEAFIPHTWVVNAILEAANG